MRRRAATSGWVTKSAAFELLLNSPADIVVLSQPSWWTLQRLLGLVGVLLLALTSTGVWITQLRRQVEQRTTQLQREIHEREQAERERALEAERARIARDLHDDLGSSLAEIAMLAKSRPLARDVQADFSIVLDAITDRARGLIAALDVIVWAVDPEENSLQSLADYFSGFADEYLSNSALYAALKYRSRFRQSRWMVGCGTICFLRSRRCCTTSCVTRVPAKSYLPWRFPTANWKLRLPTMARG